MNLRLSRIDLNLLVALQILLLERNVTRAAERLCVTPSAISKMLSRLRDVFDDELFTRSKNGLSPTPLAESLTAPLNELLSGLDNLIFPDPPNLDELTGLIRFAIPEPASIIVVPKLVSRIKRLAPNVILQIHNLLDDYQQQLADGSLDFCVYPEGNTPGLLSQSVGSVTLSCLMRSDNPLSDANTWNEEAFLSAEKIFYFAPDVARHWLTQYNEELRTGKQHMLLFETSQLFTAVETLLSTDAIMLTAGGMGNCQLCKGKVVERPVPESSLWPDNCLNLFLITHPRTQNSYLHKWVGEQIKDVIKEVMPFAK